MSVDPVRDLGPLATGDALVDAQHRHLLGMADKVWNLQDNEESRDEVESLLFQLSRYASTHFADEEALMRRTDYPELERHHSRHQQFAKEVGDMMYRYLTRNEVSPREVADFLTNWLTEHVQTEDMQMVEHINKR